MPNKLDPINISKCNGCELCTLESQRQSKVVGLEGSLIRVFKNIQKTVNRPVYSVEIDPRVNAQNLEKIKTICPKSVFEITESKS